MKPWTFGLLKPDAVANPIILKWLNEAIFNAGMVISAGCRMEVTQEEAAKLYEAHRDKFFYGRLIQHVTSGPVVIMRLEIRDIIAPVVPIWVKTMNELFGIRSNYAEYDEMGERTDKDAIKNDSECIIRWRQILGPSKVFANIYLAGGSIEDSNLQNLRQYFSLSDSRNIGHGSDSLEERTKEYNIFKDYLRPIKHPDFELFCMDRYSVESATNSVDSDVLET